MLSTNLEYNQRIDIIIEIGNEIQNFVLIFLVTEIDQYIQKEFHFESTILS